MILSIIVPVYNVQDYIEQCAKSLLFFYGKSDVEIIYVNDGSTDETVARLYESIPKSDNIHVINRKNGGLSAARNTGLKVAKGEYIFFLDGDDFIDSKAFWRLFSNGYTRGADIITGNYSKYYTETSEEKEEVAHSIGYVPVIGQSFEWYKKNTRKISSVVWRSIYKTAIIKIHGHFFHEGVVYEDCEWTPITYNISNISYYEPLYFYYYRVGRAGSIMSSNYTEKKQYDNIAIAKALIEYGNTANIEDVNCFYRYAMLQLIGDIWMLFPISSVVWEDAISLYRFFLHKRNVYYVLLRILKIFPRNIVCVILKVFYSLHNMQHKSPKIFARLI